MSKDFGTETIQGISTAAQQNQIQVTIDDSTATTLYSANPRVWGSPEEMNVDFAGPLRPTGPKSAVLKVEQRIVLNPYAAKRLALQLGQWIQQYEQTYGVIELDERKRRTAQAGPGAQPLA